MKIHTVGQWVYLAEKCANLSVLHQNRHILTGILMALLSSDQGGIIFYRNRIQAIIKCGEIIMLSIFNG
jgi:hypothetical protein